MAEEEKAVSKVEDVLAGLESFGSMIAIMMSMSGGNPLFPIMGAQYMQTLLFKLVEWGAITEDELTQVQMRMRQETARRKAEMQNEVSSDEIWTVGI